MAKYKLDDLCEFITDGTHQTPEYCEEGGVIFLSSKDVTERKINWDDVKHIPDSLHEKLYKRLRPQKNDILLAKNGTTGVAAIVDRDEIFDIYVSLAVLRPIKSIYPKYLLYAINSPVAKRQFDAGLKGIGVPNLHLGVIRETVINVAEREEQELICETLDKVAGIIDKRKAELNALDDLIKARFVEMFGDPISNPLGWKKRVLREVCTKLNDGTHFSPESFETGEYKYITAKNIKMSGFDFSNITYVSEEVHRPIYERCNPEYGDVLYIKDGVTTGIAMVNTLEEEFTLLSSVALLKQNRRIMNGYFLTALLNNESMYTDIRNNMGGAAITRLTIAKLNAIKVILPPLDLQNQFADFVHQVDKLKLQVQKSLDETQTLFDSLMQQYFG